MTVALGQHFHGSSESIDHDLNKLIDYQLALSCIFFELDVLLVMTEECKKEAFVEGISVEVTSQHFFDVDISEVLQSQFSVLKQNNDQDIWIRSKGGKERFV